MKIQYKYKYPLWTYPASAASWVVADSSAGANGGSDARRPRKQEAALAAAVPVGQKVIHFGRGKKKHVNNDLFACFKLSQSFTIIGIIIGLKITTI